MMSSVTGGGEGSTGVNFQPCLEILDNILST
jgi:hypothetical protein